MVLIYLYIYIFRVIELVRDFNLKKLVVMKTIYIKSVSTEDVKVENIHFYRVYKFNSSLIFTYFQEAIKETQILQMLNHPNIIRYYHSFQNGQNFHIVMEYATHGTIEQFVNKCSQTSNYISQNVFIYF